MDATYTERDEGWEPYDAQPDSASCRAGRGASSSTSAAPR